MNDILANESPIALALAGGAGAVLATGALLSLRRMLSTGERAETAITAVVAGIATAGATTGMWHVFTTALGMGTFTSGALCAVLELAMLASALRARRSLRKDGTVGVDGPAVWALAALSAGLSAWEQQGAVARAVRLSLPFVAAWLWERSLAADRRAARGVAGRVAWRLTPARVAVRLHLADPVERATGDVERARRLARLTRQRLRVAVLEGVAVPRPVAVLTFRPWRTALAKWRLTRQSLAAVEHLGLGRDVRVEAAILDTVRAVVQLPSATDPATVAEVGTWGRSATARPPRRTSATESPQVDRQDTTSGGPVADPATPLTGVIVARETGPVAATGGEVADMTVADQVAWFARQLPRHPGRTVPEWVAATGLAKRTVERRISSARSTDSVAGGHAEAAR